MRLSKLVQESGVSPRSLRGEAEVTGLVADSRRCRPGCCFVAVRGVHEDGHRFIPAAVAAGCAAIVCERRADAPDGMPVVVVRRTRSAAGPLAQAFWGWPARRLKCIAVTGTNGKTTVAHLARAALEAAGFRPALLGTVSYETGTRRLAASTTTPDPVALAEMMAEMVAAGRTHVVMEASSHALDQDRLAGIEPTVGVFTNLTGDHLDYHKTMGKYLAAKRRLFEGLPATATAVIHQDDPAGKKMAASTRARLLWYGLGPEADLSARIDRTDSSGTEYRLVWQGREAVCRTRLIGRHNVQNALAAAGACLALGVELETVARALSSAAGAPGRLQRVEGLAACQVFVDYAHTDDALRNVLSALRGLKGAGRIVLVFGCGGDRDRTKRPRMGRVAEELADRIVVTSDNPRSEEPQAIIEEILAGISAAGRRKTHVESDRQAAIERAIREAAPGDVVLIAGKGHEDYQIVGSQRLPFDDVAVAGEIIRRREGRP